MSSNGALLRASAVGKKFGGVVALREVHLSVHRGEILALIGPNGAGKTTLFNVLCGVLPPGSGEVWFDGHRLAGLRPHQIAALGMARTFQNLQLFGNMSVVENVMVARETRSRAGLLAAALRLPSALSEEQHARRAAEAILALVGLQGRGEMLASELPFGQQRLLEIARALATEPRLLLLDEPAAGLSAAERSGLVDLVRRTREGGVTVLIVEHDVALVMDVADRVVVLDHGEKIAEGTPAQVQADRRVIVAYLGEES